ncbi:hypothetical protein MNBD_NITROSPINAE03-1314 [hydrothermal vent metagenome]|uniref:Uncharacterized protein n=1 Tax=hydrothermal vent metagenome TaxID=652676 RepID=A0A3B1D874_9ZZZZ
MGDLKDHIFLHYANLGVEEARREFVEKHVPKKKSRFLIKGITYEIGSCHVDSGDFVYEISSKIPQEALPKKTTTEKYFKEVLKIVNRSEKKPVNPKLENIVHNTADLEVKERDYVKLTYRYCEDELYTYAEVEKRLRLHKEKNIPLPDVPGIVTPGGKLVVVLIKESMTNLIRQNVTGLIKANDDVKKTMAAKIKSRDDDKELKEAGPAAKKKTASKSKPKKKK